MLVIANAVIWIFCPNFLLGKSTIQNWEGHFSNGPY